MDQPKAKGSRVDWGSLSHCLMQERRSKSRCVKTLEQLRPGMKLFLPNFWLAVEQVQPTENGRVIEFRLLMENAARKGERKENAT